MLRFTWDALSLVGSQKIIFKTHTCVFTGRKSFPWDICLNLPKTANIFLLQSYPLLRNFSSPNYVIAFKRNVRQRDARTPLPRKSNIFRILRHIFCTELKFDSLNLILYKNNAIAFKNIRNNLFPLRFYIFYAIIFIVVTKEIEKLKKISWINFCTYGGEDVKRRCIRFNGMKRIIIGVMLRIK